MDNIGNLGLEASGSRRVKGMSAELELRSQNIIEVPMARKIVPDVRSASSD